VNFENGVQAGSIEIESAKSSSGAPRAVFAIEQTYPYSTGMIVVSVSSLTSRN